MIKCVKVESAKILVKVDEIAVAETLYVEYQSTDPSVFAQTECKASLLKNVSLSNVKQMTIAI